jgi:uncharacterized protein (TIGR00255 family)
MTGFGSATFSNGAGTWRIEVRAVNHKSLSLRLHWPSEFAALEHAVTRLVRDRLGRGAVDLSVIAESVSAEAFDVHVEREALAALMRELRHVAADVGAPPPTLEAVLKAGPFVEVRRRRVDAGDVESLLLEGVSRALDGLVTMREAEGAALAADLLERIGRIDALVEVIAQAAPEVLRGFEERLRARLAEADLRLGLTLDKERALTEVVVFADKSDLTEEIVRARTHLAAFRGVLGAEGDSEKGRRLDFMVQEILRELNTMGSKCRDAAIAQQVVEGKVELEKIREQVQNIA